MINLLFKDFLGSFRMFHFAPGAEILLMMLMILIWILSIKRVFSFTKLKITTFSPEDQFEADRLMARSNLPSKSDPRVILEIEKIDNLGKAEGLEHRERGTLFEEELIRLFSKLPDMEAITPVQYRAETGITIVGQDQGCDLVIKRYKPGTRELVSVVIAQAKLYADKVGNDAVAEIKNAIDIYRPFSKDPNSPELAMVITNNYFTKSAIEAAEKSNIDVGGPRRVLLVDRDSLMDLIAYANNPESGFPKEEKEDDFYHSEHDDDGMEHHDEEYLITHDGHETETES
jgi:hypothetical protein